MSGASRSLAFLLEKLDPRKYNGMLNCIFDGVVLDLFKDKPVTLIKKRGIYPFHGSTVTGIYPKLFIMNFLKVPSTLVTAIKVIRKEKPDLIHLNSSSLFMVAVAAKMIDKNIKVICHVREPLLPNSIAGSIIKYMNYRFIDYFIAIDHYTGASMKVKGNMEVIYNSVNFKDYHPGLDTSLLRRELGLPRDTIIFLYLARVAKCNGAYEFVEVAQTLSEKYPHYHFILTGIKPTSKDSYTLKTISKAKGNKNLHMMSFRDDVPNLLAGSDILVVPFTEPHFARAIIEAAAIGIPTIGSDVGGVNELVVNNETGFLYRNRQQWLEYCIKLAENPKLRNQFGNAAIQFAKENFDNDLNTKKVFTVYDRLLFKEN